MATDPDEDDLRQVIEGDGRAASRLYGKYAFRLYRLAFLALRDSAEAEDVMQETFLRLWKQAQNWKPGTPLLPWLLRVAANLCNDRIRRRRWLVHEPPPDRADPAESGFETLQSGQVQARMRWAMAKLPSRQRRALQLTAGECLSNAEAGAALGISELAMESLLARARRNLRKWLLPYRADLIGDADGEI